MSEAIRATGLSTFEKDVIDASRRLPVIVDFWAGWCGPCRTLAPILENVARDLTGRVAVLKVDTDAEQQLATRFQIRSIPTVMLFRDGKVATQFMGVQPEHAIRDWLTPFLAPAEAPASDSAERLAEQALAAGDSAAARRHLEAVPADRADTEGVRALKGRLAFADELPDVSSGKSDLDALYAEGLQAAVRGANVRAAEAFLTLTTRSRAYRDDAGRRAMLRLFEIVGPADPLADEYRRRLARSLH